MLEETFKLFDFLEESDSFDLSGSQKWRMSKLRLLALGPWNQLCKIFFKETAELDHNNEELLACWAILDDKTFQGLVVLHYRITLLFGALSGASRTNQQPQPLLCKLVSQLRNDEHGGENLNARNKILKLNPHATHLVVIAELVDTSLPQKLICRLLLLNESGKVLVQLSSLMIVN